MKYRIVYERAVNVMASSLAMVAQRLPFLKGLTPIFGAAGGGNFAAPLAVTFVGTHALSGQSLTLVPVNGATDTASVGVGEGFVWLFKLSDDEHDIEAFSSKTNGVVETLPEGLALSGPQSRIYFLSGTPTEPGEYSVTIVGYRRSNRVGDSTAPYSLTLTVEGGSSPFDGFLSDFWAGEDLSNPELVAATADPDGDGIDNALEFVLGLDPTKSDTMPGAMGVDPADATMFRYEVPLNVLAAAASVTLQESSDLEGDFTEVAAESIARTDTSIVLSVPLIDKKFYRLKVEL